MTSTTGSSLSHFALGGALPTAQRSGGREMAAENLIKLMNVRSRNFPEQYPLFVNSEPTIDLVDYPDSAE